jgi:hypothetical protein
MAPGAARRLPDHDRRVKRVRPLEEATHEALVELGALPPRRRFDAQRGCGVARR